MQRDARSDAAYGVERGTMTSNPDRAEIRAAVEALFRRALADFPEYRFFPRHLAAAAEALPYDCWSRGNTEQEALRFLRSTAAPIMAAAVAAEAIEWGAAIPRLLSRRDEH
jgi:hypothetical protein